MCDFLKSLNNYKRISMSNKVISGKLLRNEGVGYSVGGK